ncbi:MAG: DUF2029 domain-containing protein [Acidimicrobiales bacterium]|nr:DUF2029 domain-containing protein [Acidimicrobiales bacterium]
MATSTGRPLLGLGARADGEASAAAPLGLEAATGEEPVAVDLRAALLDALPAWLVSRGLVVLALVAAHLSVAHLRPDNAAAAQRVHDGLLSWDAGWYESIAAHGYGASGPQSLRFFPGFPMAARALSWIPGVSVGAALVVLANLAALGAFVALGVLVRRDLGDAALARRSVWLLALAPSAYALVLGYADAALLLLAVLTLLLVRRHRWWWAAATGLAAGLVRPVGALLLVPALVEALRDRGSSSAPAAGAAGGRAGWLPRLAAVAAPVAGCAAYLAWVGAQFGDPWLPLRVQQQHGHRGPLTAPLSAMWHNTLAVLHGHHLGSALHIPWVVLCLALLVLAYRRLPGSYAALATAVLAVSLTSSNLDSFECYALGAFPLVVAASTLTARRWVEVTVLAVSAAAMTGYALAAFVGVVVP